MRHRLHHKTLNRTSEHRKALLRNMAQSMVEHGKVQTTLPKAKTLKPYIEKLVTLAVRARRRAADGDDAGSLRARRRIHRMLGDRSLIPKEHQSTYEQMSDAARAKTLRMASGRRHRTGEPKGRLVFTGESVIHRLIESVAAQYEDRPGGYTRLIRLGKRRIGDHSPLAILQFVGDEEVPTSLTKPAKSARQRRADARYALAVKLAKQRPGKKEADRLAEEEEASGQEEEPPEASGAAEPEALQGSEEQQETDASSEEGGDEEKAGS
jgi:large subunit ribosomal protein L17